MYIAWASFRNEMHIEEHNRSKKHMQDRSLHWLTIHIPLQSSNRVFEWPQIGK